jgi:Bacterial Ig-like domain (group 2)
MERGRLIPTALTVAYLTMLVSCAGPGTVSPPPTGSTATLSVTADLSGTAVATVVVDVSASDISTMLVFNIPIVNGIASGTVTIPAGSNRTIVLRGYDAGGVETHTGTVTTTVQPGSNATLSLVLTPLTGDVPINATLGYYIVTVTPPSPSLSVNGTAQLTATIKDSDGNPIAGVVSWATHDPGVAIVDATGLVTATGAGTTTISAVFQGIAGNTSVTVTP